MDQNLLAKCRDQDWRLRNFYYIVDKQSQRIPFKPNPIQERINKSTSKRKLILKARQFGVTTNEVLKMFDSVCYNFNYNVCILAHEKDAIEKIFNIAKTAYSYLYPTLKPELDRGGGSKYAMRFPAHNTKIFCDLESRGDTIHHLHVSEAAFCDPARLMATLEAVPLDGIVTLESTPNGLGNYFYERWIEQNSDYEKMFFPWFKHEEYNISTPRIKLTDEEKKLKVHTKKWYGVDISEDQIAFRRAKQKDLRELFFQEYPENDIDCFLTSGTPALDLVKVKELLDNHAEPITEQGPVKIFKAYSSNCRYVAGADTAEGTGGDNSALVILDRGSLEVVATLKCNLKPSDFAHECYNLLKQYSKNETSWPLLAVERNNHGHAVLLELSEHLGYANLYKTKDGKVGWLTDRVSRPIMINAFRDGLENNSMKINDREILLECLSLENNKGKIEAANGHHDDMIIASSIALQMAISENVDSIYDDIDKHVLV